jgi:hypothetical protein
VLLDSRYYTARSVIQQFTGAADVLMDDDGAARLKANLKELENKKRERAA